MQKNIASQGILWTVLALAGAAVTPAHAATTNANASAIILAPVQVTKTADLAFATVLPGATSDAVAVSAMGVRTCGAALVCSGTVAAAAFDVAGSAGYSYAVSLPSTITLTSGANTMSVNGFSTNKAGNVGTLSAGGTDSFSVGATLNVGANQAAGAYSGSFVVTVNYN